MNGKLYVIGTPIGNPQDISVRALRILREVQIVATEDPRSTHALLRYHGIHATLTTYDHKTREEKIPILIQRLRDGQKVALVSDCGTPAIYDPGSMLVSQAHHVGIQVVPVPGPSAIIGALSVSGLSGDAFLFHGPLPRTAKPLARLLKSLKSEIRTLVFFQASGSPRITLTLALIRRVLGNRHVCLAQGMTTKTEQVIRGTAETLQKCRRSFSGEVTLIVEGYRGRASAPKRMPNITRVDVSESSLDKHDRAAPG
ncbi:MAG: 16S rRNA (cytidine(1402)-2'-O)-methyltransferase [Nitrospiraceae bacterium]